MKKEWLKFAGVITLYILFLLWLKSWLGLIVVPFIFDAYITKKIPWKWWKDSLNPITVQVMSWVDAIVFALVAVYFVNLFFFQNFVIPSSSLEKSLRVGDYLFVSKLSYGPRIPQTPLTMPLTQHTLPILGCKSYLDKPQWDYRRVKGFGQVKLNDIVVFNYPSGDTVAINIQNMSDYHMESYLAGEQLYAQLRNHGRYKQIDTLDRQTQLDITAEYFALGSSYIKQNKKTYGEVISRPVDRRENYVKRCVGMPGQTLEIKNRTIFLDGVANKEPDEVQFSYQMILKGRMPISLARDLDISDEDLYSWSNSKEAEIPLTNANYQALKARTDLVEHIEIAQTKETRGIYPHNVYTGWTQDNYGPIWIPAKGETLQLTMDNIAVYERPIRIYESNDLVVKDNKIYINGEVATSYTFKMDYYWMMGDNRHRSSDSRYWGFVPEDHVVGKPIFIWLSLDKDRGWFSGKVRWNRLFTLVDNIK